MKKCTQCGQILNDDTKFCYKCGGSNYEPVAESGETYQQPTYQQPPQQPAQQSYYAQQPPQQNYYAPQPGYQQPYQAQPSYNNDAPATIGTFLIFFLLMLIPIFNIVWLIMVAVGGPRHNKSLTSFARASLIWGAIIFVLYLIVFLVIGASLADMFGGRYYY